MQLRSARKHRWLPTILNSSFHRSGGERSLSVVHRMPTTLSKFPAVYAFLYATGLTCSANRHVRGECGARRPLTPSRSFNVRPFLEIGPFQRACDHLQPILAVEHIAIYHIGRRTKHTAADRLFGIGVIDFSHLW